MLGFDNFRIFKVFEVQSFYFLIFDWGNPPQVGSWSNVRLELLQPLEEPSGNCQMTHTDHTEFVSWHVELIT